VVEQPPAPDSEAAVDVDVRLYAKVVPERNHLTG
jgi:hypothetical protein